MKSEDGGFFLERRPVPASELPPIRWVGSIVMVTGPDGGPWNVVFRPGRDPEVSRGGGSRDR